MHHSLILLKKILLHTLKTALVVYILLCLLLYFFQERIIFFPEKTDKNHPFRFREPFTEMTVKARDGTELNGLLFTADSSKGLVFYLHGNAGSLRTWGEVAATYTTLHYDVFILDYRGYGKSGGRISSESQVFEDVQTAYDTMKHSYPEDKIVVLGYSIGTGMAAKLASANRPKQLILQAPYYSLTEVMKDQFPFLPAFLLKYKFATNVYVKDCRMPVLVFHGEEDEVIPYRHSLQLKPLLKPGDVLITLQQQGHNGITDNEDYKRELEKWL